jgi:hypothetical protein
LTAVADWRKGPGRRPKADYVAQNFADFKSTSWWNSVAYFGIFSGTIISMACYAADMWVSPRTETGNMKILTVLL